MPPYSYKRITWIVAPLYIFLKKIKEDFVEIRGAIISIQYINFNFFFFSTPPVICGYNSGQHMWVPASDACNKAEWGNDNNNK